MWNPEKTKYEELLSLLSQSLSKNNELQKEIFKKISDLSKLPDFTNYLLFVFNQESLEISTRLVAGLSLKGYIERSFNKLGAGSIAYFKTNILTFAFHKHPQIRKTILILIKMFILLGTLSIWPELLEYLLQILEDQSTNVVHISLEAINMILEENSQFFIESNSKVKFLHSSSSLL